MIKNCNSINITNTYLFNKLNSCKITEIEKNQFMHFIKFIVDHLSIKNYPSEVEKLKELSEDVTGSFKGTTILDLNASVLEKKQAILRKYIQDVPYQKDEYKSKLKINKIEGQTVVLSKFIDDTRADCIVIKHTEPTEIAKALPYLEKLYHSLYSMQITTEEDKFNFIKISGEFFWWFCEVKPVNRGDPSIAEIMIRALWKMKGIESPAWKVGLIPWAEVVKELNPKKFALLFHTLFDSIEWSKKAVDESEIIDDKICIIS